MHGLMQLSTGWAQERPEASKIGLVIMGASLLAFADAGVELASEERQKELKDVSEQAFQLMKDDPQDAFQLIYNEITTNHDESNADTHEGGN